MSYLIFGTTSQVLKYTYKPKKELKCQKEKQLKMLYEKFNKFKVLIFFDSTKIKILSVLLNFFESFKDFHIFTTLLTFLASFLIYS